jgi:hypothetical protein
MVFKVFMNLILLGKHKACRGYAPQIPFLSPEPPKSPFTPFLTRGQGDLLAVGAKGKVHNALNGLFVHM